MANKFESFLKDKNIDQRRILSASRQIERLRPADRATRLKLKQARNTEDAKRPEGLDKPRSGKSINPVTVRRALAGGRMSAVAKVRMLRAVNRILKQRKQNPATLADLFE